MKLNLERNVMNGSIALILVGLGVALMASGQSSSSSWSLITLVEPIPAVPLYAEQSEERILLFRDVRQRTDTRTTRIFRDSAGRIRLEVVQGGEYVQSPMVVTIVDPPARSVVTLLPAEAIGARITSPFGKPFKPAFPSIEGELREGSPGTKTLDLGVEVVEGIDFRGTRTEPADRKPETLATYTERWHSVPLGLTRSIVVVTSSGSHSATLRLIRRGEPDPAIFVVPPTYKIEDAEWP